MITYDDFAKIELRIATVKEAVAVEGSGKLVRLQVELADPSMHSGQVETRQILSGIIRQYPPETLVGRQVVIVANLEPRSMMGLESQGMLLAADGEDGPVVLIPEKPVASGAKIK